MESPPRRRTAGIIFEEMGAGGVVYDIDANEAHSLNPAAMRVLAACDGTNTVAEIARINELEEACVYAVLEQLETRDLLHPARTVSRRAMLRRAAAVGAAAAAAAPLVETVIIPTASAHASTGMTSGNGGSNGGGTPPGPAVRLVVSGSAVAAAGSPQSVTVTAEDSSGNVATSYTGTIHFTSSDPAAILPSDYTFSVSDAGSHTFTGVTLQTAGSQTVTATDDSNPSITGTETVIVS